MIKDPFKDIYDVLSSDEKMFAFFAPQIQNMEKVISDLAEKSETIRQNQQKLGLLQEQLALLSLPVPKQ